MKFNEKATQSVEQYTEAILKAVNGYSPDTESDVEMTDAFNTAETEKAGTTMITTKFGVVVVFPNFTNNKKAHACVLKIGTIRGMEAEGFDNEFIEAEGPIYGALLPHSESSVDVLAYYLTHKIEPTVANEINSKTK